MSSATGLSGLRAAAFDLDVIGNNIANGNTVGFKQSRAEFADVYSSSVNGVQIGGGVNLTTVTQDFGQGTYTNTGRNFDLAIGAQNGFFVLQDPQSGATSYSRAGNFQVDKDNFITSPSGEQLTGFQAISGNITSSIAPLQLSTASLPAKASGKVEIDLNLDAAESILVPLFSNTDPTSYNARNSLEMFDSLGNAHSLAAYYVKTADNNWDVHVEVDGSVIATGALTFDSAGALTSETGLTSLSFSPGNGAASPQLFDVSLSNSSQFATSTLIRDLNQNGYTSGNLTSVDIDGDGMLMGRYSNGQLNAIGQVSIAKFDNPQGLISIGNNSWLESRTSGNALVSVANSEGAIKPGALEDANVNLTEQMVMLVTAQRNFQINAKTIQAEDILTQTILNLQ